MSVTAVSVTSLRERMSTSVAASTPALSSAWLTTDTASWSGRSEAVRFRFSWAMKTEVSSTPRVIGSDRAQRTSRRLLRYPLHRLLAPDYLIDRLGSDLANDDRFSVGYAPDSWTALTTHLRRHGATDEEIVGAGRGSYASTGRVIDRSRDRLVVPIQATGPDGETEIHGFIGRRNPAKRDDENAGPKYLNTSETDLFTKGRELYGLIENAAALAAGATPCWSKDRSTVSPSPSPATARTSASPPWSPRSPTPKPTRCAPTSAPPGPASSWPPTPTGPGSRPRTARSGRSPLAATTHVTCSSTTARTPPSLLQTHGPAALKTGFDQAGPLADTVIADRTAPWADRLDTVEGSVYATRAAAQVAALPASTWPACLTGIVARTDIAHQTAIEELFDAHTDWLADPHATAKRHLAERLPDPTPTDTGSTAAPSTSTPPAPLPAARQWAVLADSLVPDLSSDPGWSALAASLDRAAQTGYDITAQLPVLITTRPLPEDHIARSLELRLANAHPASMAPLSAVTRGAAQVDADAATRTRHASVDATMAAPIPAEPEPLERSGDTGRPPQQRPRSTPDPRRGPSR